MEKSKIELFEKTYEPETFDLNFKYKYEFWVNSNLHSHELVYGFTEDLIELLKDQFGEELRKYLIENRITKEMIENELGYEINSFKLDPVYEGSKCIAYSVRVEPKKGIEYIETTFTISK